MKLLYICNEVNRKNGWAVINYYTVLEATRRNHQVWVATEKGANNLSIAGVEYLEIFPPLGKLGSSWWQSLKAGYVLYKLTKRVSPEIVHIMVEPLLIYGLVVRGSKIFMTIVGTYCVSIFKKSRLRNIYRYTLKRVSKIVSISDYTTRRFNKEVAQIVGIPTLPMGVDIDFFRLNHAKNVSKMQFSFVGHIKERKGLIYALEALSIVRRKYPQVVLKVAGTFDNPRYADKCQKLVLDEGMAENVQFLGRVDQSGVKQLYAESIMNLLPSFNSSEGSFEGFGLIHLEANAAQTLTLGSWDSGNESAIRDGESGFLVKQKDIESIAEKMIHAIEIYQEGLYDSYSARCLKYAEDRTWSGYFDKLESEYLKSIKI